VGTLRTIFAISVVFTHCWPTDTVFVGGQNAVHLFYIISGFLISFVLVEHRSYKDLYSFYLNRYLRLYPIYLVVAVLTLIAIVVTKQPIFFGVYKAAPFNADVMLIFSNIFLFGQDWVVFSSIKQNLLMFPTDFATRTSDVLLFHGLIVPQAWTLGVELSFYLIAPFVLPRRYAVYVILMCSLFLRFPLMKIGIGTKDPWTFSLFPADLAFFLFGALAHQVLLPLYRRRLKDSLSTASSIATYLLIFLALIFSYIPLSEALKTTILFSSFLALIPFTFIFQDQHRLDNWIGNLSYPIYIGHMLIIRIFGYTSKHLNVLSNPYVFATVTVVSSIVFALVLNKWIGEPFDEIRKRFRSPPRGALDLQHPGRNK
jgi:peptidoglycan/LPS O-acetylase OafA/YrhL